MTSHQARGWRGRRGRRVEPGRDCPRAFPSGCAPRRRCRCCSSTPIVADRAGPYRSVSVSVQNLDGNTHRTVVGKLAGMDTPEQLNFTESEAANRLLASDGLALLIGMLLDQQFPMERAFYGPYLLAERLGEDLDEERIAHWDPEELATMFQRPAGDPPVLVGDGATHPGALFRRSSTTTTAGPRTSGRRRKPEPSCSSVSRRCPGSATPSPASSLACWANVSGGPARRWEEKAADWPSIADVATFDDVATLRLQKKAMKAVEKGLKSPQSS